MTRGRVIDFIHKFSGEEVNVLYIDYVIDSQGKVGSNENSEIISAVRCCIPTCHRYTSKKPVFPLTTIPRSGLCCRTVFYMIEDQFRTFTL